MDRYVVVVDLSFVRGRPWHMPSWVPSNTSRYEEEAGCVLINKRCLCLMHNCRTLQSWITVRQTETEQLHIVDWHHWLWGWERMCGALQLLATFRHYSKRESRGQCLLVRWFSRGRQVRIDVDNVTASASSIFTSVIVFVLVTWFIVGAQTML